MKRPHKPTRYQMVINVRAYQQGMTLTQLASAIGMEYATMYQQMRRGSVRFETIERMANALNLKPIDLMRDIVEMKGGAQ